MLVAVILFLGGLAVGLRSHVMVALGLSAGVVALSLVAWIVRGEVSVLACLVLLAHLTALQAGYLLGAYLRCR